MLTIQSGTKLQKTRTSLSNDTLPTASEKKLLAVKIDSGRSAISITKLKAETLNMALSCSIVYRFLIFIFFLTLSNWTPAGRHLTQINQNVD